MDQNHFTTDTLRKKGAHLTFEERVIIQTRLRDKQSYRSIAREIGCCVNTVPGLGLKPAAENAGLDVFHGSAGRMVRNTHYLGDAFYPAIIKKELFDKAEEIRMARASSLGRVREWETPPKLAADKKFTMPSVKMKFTDPFEQAEYAYSLIESEVTILE